MFATGPDDAQAGGVLTCWAAPTRLVRCWERGRPLRSLPGDRPSLAPPGLHAARCPPSPPPGRGWRRRRAGARGTPRWPPTPPLSPRRWRPRTRRWHRSTSMRCWRPRRRLTTLPSATRACGAPTSSAGATAARPGARGGGRPGCRGAGTGGREGAEQPALLILLAVGLGGRAAAFLHSRACPAHRAPQVPAAAGAQAGPGVCRLRAHDQRGHGAAGGAGAAGGGHCGAPAGEAGVGARAGGSGGWGQGRPWQRPSCGVRCGVAGSVCVRLWWVCGARMYGVDPWRQGGGCPCAPCWDPGHPAPAPDTPPRCL